MTPRHLGFYDSAEEAAGTHAFECVCGWVGGWVGVQYLGLYDSTEEAAGKRVCGCGCLCGCVCGCDCVCV